MTPVEFQFLTPTGDPVAAAVISIQLSSAGYDNVDTGILIPREIFATTDVNGKATVNLWPSDVMYYVTMDDPASEATLFYKFYVPVMGVPGTHVRLQDIIVDAPMSGTTYDTAALLDIHNAKSNAMAAQVTAQAAASDAAASATSASAAKTSVDNSVAYIASETTLAVSAANSAQASRDLAITKAGESLTSATNSATSAAAANVSAGTATTQATSAQTSATTSTANAASSTASSTAATASQVAAAASAAAALASKTAAGTSETNSATSAAAALVSQNAASTSATNAAGSATSASTSKDAAAASATTSIAQAAISTTQATNSATSATAAAGSATTATTQATTATTQAGASATSATASAGSATAAAGSATAASTSATAAAGSATAAATSKTNAGTSETNAAASAVAANTSKVNAGTSETNAATSAAAALASKNAAGVSETNAAGSATAANTSKVNAGTSETNAAASATAAAGSATTASTGATTATTQAAAASASQTAAANSASAAATSAQQASAGQINADWAQVDTAQKSFIQNKPSVSGVNSGDETTATIKTKLGIATLSGANTGDQTISLTGDVTGTGTGSFAATIAARVVTFAKQAAITTATLLGRNTAGTGDIEVLSPATARAILSLDQVSNTSDANKPVSTAQAAADTATLTSAKTYADGLVVGLWDDRGNYDASVNTFPAAGGSGNAGAVLKGDIWTMSVAGTLGGTPVSIRQTVRAMIDAPGQTAANWALGLANTDIDDSITGGITGRSASQNAIANALALKAPLASPTFTGTVSGITATMVGLPNVANTTDANKPVSLAQQAALDLKAPLASPVFTGAVTLPAGSSAPGILGSSANAITATGTNQAGAAAMTNDVNIVTSSTAGTGLGVVVPGATSGKYAVVVNRSANAINVYPAAGHAFDGLGANTPISLPVNGFLEMFGSSGTQWHTSTNALLNVSAINASGVPSNTTVLRGDGAWTNAINGAVFTDYTETYQSPAPGSAITANPAVGTLIELATTANCTITLPAAVAGKSYTLMVTYGGAHTLTFAGGTSLHWSGGTAPSATSVAGKTDIFVFTCNGTKTFARSGGSNY